MNHQPHAEDKTSADAKPKKVRDDHPIGNERDARGVPGSH